MNKYEFAICIWVLAIVLLLIFAPPIIGLSHPETITITVLEKERVSFGKGSKYLVWTEDEVFQNTDLLLYGKVRSADLQGKLRVGGTYRVRVCGRRMPTLSMYRNIVRLEP